MLDVKKVLFSLDLDKVGLCLPPRGVLVNRSAWSARVGRVIYSGDLREVEIRRPFGVKLSWLRRGATRVGARALESLDDLICCGCRVTYVSGCLS